MSGASVRQLRDGFRWGHRPAVPRTAVAHRPVHERREFGTGWARSPVARAARAAIQAGALTPLVHAEVTPVVHGLDRLAALGDQPCVIVANHASHLDTAVLLTALPPEVRRRTAVAAAADYFFDAWWRAAGTALVFATVPIERRGGAPSRTPSRLLAQGWNVVVFPEGTRSRDGWLGRFRLGAATLALERGVPVLPVAIRGTHAAMPRGRAWPAPGRPQVHVLFGPPLQPRPDDTAAELSLRVAAAIERLLDEDATDWWSSLRRSNAGGTPIGAAPEPGSVVAATWRRRWEGSRPVDAATPARQRVWR
jgi:1-acyl-sn-glycerol-3-phosphate acyltransferase